MSPGDETYPEPYFYVVPYPTLAPDGLPDLPAGAWHTEGWVGAVFTASEVIPTGDSQAEVVASFVRTTVSASKGLLMGTQ